MREIKFRAWDKEAKRWLLDFMVLPNGQVQIQSPSATLPELEWRFAHEDIALMQYTGLRDKNGREIYEGDIIFGDHSGVPYAQVFWDGLGFALKAGDRKGDLIASDSYLSGKQCEWLEVICDIYENPELVHSSLADSPALDKPGHTARTRSRFGTL
jgi:hypothetical protein